MPVAAVFAVFLFVVAELVTGVVWRPSVVGEPRYSELALSYDYAYASDFPRLFREGELLRYYPTEYADLRGFTIERRKLAREIRIFVLGSSVTRAADVSFGSAYPEQLETILNERHPEHDWKVVNLAASGFGTARMLRVLSNMARHEPDAIIVHPHGTNEYEDERDARQRAKLYSGLNGLFLRSRLVVLLKKLEDRRFGSESEPSAPANAEQIASADPENVERWMAGMSANVARIDCVAEALGVPSIYVGRAERDAEWFRDENVLRLNSPIRSREHFLDVAGRFTDVANEYGAEELFMDFTHYTELGHRMVAEELYELVRPGGELFEGIMERRESERVDPGVVRRRCLDSSLEVVRGAAGG